MSKRHVAVVLSLGLGLGQSAFAADTGDTGGTSDTASAPLVTAASRAADKGGLSWAEDCGCATSSAGGAWILPFALLLGGLAYRRP